jgi:hypothetical protein
LKTTSHTSSVHEVLDADHPYRRALDNITAVRRQMKALAAFTLLVGCLARHTLTRALPLEVCGVVVEALLALILIGEITTRRRAARNLIIHRSADGLAEIREEARRLQSRRYTLKLAARLERALNDALHLHRIPVASRPPPTAANLVRHRRALDAIASALRSVNAPLRAIALTDRLLDGGYTARIYTLPAPQLAEEISRIHMVLAVDSPVRLGSCSRRAEVMPVDQWLASSNSATRTSRR